MTIPVTDDHRGGAVPADAGVWAAPGRVNLIGEHTDYNDGYVLPFALPYRAEVTAHRWPGPPGWTVTSRHAPEPVTLTPDDLDPGRVTGWAGYVAGIIWALTEAGHRVPGADLAIDSTVPVGAGLSSSAALECAVLAALCDLGDLDLPIADRPRLAQRAENAYVGVPCGVMDQAASTLCREGHALFLDCRSLDTEHVPFDLAAEGLAMLVVNSGSAHAHVEGEYAARRDTCDRAARELGVPALRDLDEVDLDATLARLSDPVARRRVRHVVTEDRRVLRTVALLRAGRTRDIGPLLTESHASMRDDYEITAPAVDLAVEAALAAGAYGARMTGGGFGGCVLALVDADAVDAVTAEVTGAFQANGYPPPPAFVATAGPGAHRLR